MLKKIFREHRLFILYCIIGLNGIVVEMVTFLVVLDILQQDKLVANVASMITSVSHNFLLNYHFNFHSKGNFWLRYVTYYAVSLVGLAISSTVLVIGVDLLHLEVVPVKLFSIVIVTVTQFNLNRLITFRKLSPHHT
ncbi:MAG: GtrA family protein [Candidatus Doudnabacteria bacterium]|nr:GtrA family protein [Candidatus Doudnabacteria bacterium]